MGPGTVSPTVVDQLGATAELMLADLDRVCAEMDAAVAQAAPVLTSDPLLEAELSASERANLRRFLTAVGRRDGRPLPADVPPEALDIARTVVRRGIDVEVSSTATAARTASCGATGWGMRPRRCRPDQRSSKCSRSRRS
jgi:hypothetical protein